MSPWWPLPNWAQQGSFVEPVNPPGVEFDSAPLACVRFSAAWMPYVLGALQQLIQPSSWVVADNAALNDVLLNATDLIGSIGQGGECVDFRERLQDCVLQYSVDGGVTYVDVAGWAANLQGCIATRIAPPTPPNPAGTVPVQQACNLSGWLAVQVLQKATAAQVANRAAADTQDGLIKSLLHDVFAGVPIAGGVIDAAYALFGSSHSFPEADLTAASTDAGLLTSLTKSIFSATSAKGYVDATNFGQVASNIAAISYPAQPLIPIMLSAFWTSLTLTTIQFMQTAGALNVADCSSFDTPWCFYIDFSVTNGGAILATPTQSGEYTGGLGWTSTPTALSGVGEVYFAIDLGASYNITEIQVQYFSKSGRTSGRPHEIGIQTGPFAAWTEVHDIVFGIQFPGEIWESQAFSSSGRYIAVALDDASSGSTPPVSGVTGLQIRGTGVNPFGRENCVVGV